MVIRRWQQWRELNGRQQRMLLAALLLSGAISILLRLFLYRDVYQRLEVLFPLREMVGQPEAGTRAAETAAIVELAARRRVANATCLRRSLVLWLMLRRQGIESDLRLGVRKQDGELAGHAWVEIEGIVINDEANIAQQYEVIDLEKPA